MNAFVKFFNANLFLLCATLNVPLNAEAVICLLNYPNSTLVSKYNSP